MVQGLGLAWKHNTNTRKPGERELTIKPGEGEREPHHMSVLIETSLGDIVIDLHLTHAPFASSNFLKQCLLRNYNGVLFHRVVPGFLAQTGDPTGTGTGGTSVLQKDVPYFNDELVPRQINHNIAGTIGMSHTNGKANENGSQWYITLRDNLGDQLDGKFTVFGNIVEDDHNVVAALNAAHVDEGHRPYEDIRIFCTHVLDDPFPTPVHLIPVVEATTHIKNIKQHCVIPPVTETINPRDPYGKYKSKKELLRLQQEQNIDVAAKIAKGSARTLEIIGDLPDADARPPENVLFVCKLNKVTDSDSLHLIFSRFGTILSCHVVKDVPTQQSLQYAFIEFEQQESCEEAYMKMNNVLIDDRRIKVDFSQSISKEWNKWSGQWQQFRKKGGSGGGGGGGSSSGGGGGSSNGGSSRVAVQPVVVPAPTIENKEDQRNNVESSSNSSSHRHHHRRHHHRSSTSRKEGEGGESSKRRHHHHHRSSSSSHRDKDRGREGDRDRDRGRDRGRDRDRDRDRDRHRHHRSKEHSSSRDSKRSRR